FIDDHAISLRCLRSMNISSLELYRRKRAESGSNLSRVRGCKHSRTLECCISAGLDPPHSPSGLNAALESGGAIRGAEREAEVAPAIRLEEDLGEGRTPDLPTPGAGLGASSALSERAEEIEKLSHARH